MAEQFKLPRSVSPDRFLDMVRAGVHDVMRELMTSGSNAPAADFYGAVQAGVEAAVKATVRLREAPVQDSAPTAAAEEG